MVISIDFCGIQRSHTKTGSIKINLSRPTKVTDVLEYIKIKYPELPIDQSSILATVNHEVATLERELKANDKVSFFPHIGGG
jgi:molybdopterin converting factor small subunit